MILTFAIRVFKFIIEACHSLRLCQSRDRRWYHTDDEAVKNTKLLPAVNHTAMRMMEQNTDVDQVNPLCWVPASLGIISRVTPCSLFPTGWVIL